MKTKYQKWEILYVEEQGKDFTVLTAKTVVFYVFFLYFIFNNHRLLISIESKSLVGISHSIIVRTISQKIKCGKMKL